MANKRLRTGTLPAIMGIVQLYLFFGVLLAFYIISNYIPYLLTGIVLLTPALLLTVLALFSKPLKLKERTEKEPHPKRIVRILRKTGGFFIAIGRLLKKAYNNTRPLIKAFLIIAVFIGMHLFFWLMFRESYSPVVSLWESVAMVMLFVVAIVIDKICKHAEFESEMTGGVLRSLRAYMRPVYVVIVLCMVGTALTALSLWNTELYLRYILAGVFCYMTVFALISVVITMIRGEIDKCPRTVMPAPFVKGDDDVSVIDFLEKNTGITMRGLWSMRYIKHIAPITGFMIAGFLWLSTCLVQIDSGYQGAVYRLGALQKEVLEPGIHLALPYPFDKIKIFNTDKVNRVTIGYDSTEDTDNIWTGGHGSNEHKLLLGGGDELVSINLRLEYKIKDLYTYLTGTSSPESILQSQAYDLVTDMTIETDLTTLLSVDRQAFANRYNSELQKMLSGYDTGIEIVSVVLESIHPPLEIAAVYQRIISAEITAEKAIIDAESIAATAIANAEAKRDTLVSEAQVEQSQKIAAANTSVAEFMAGVDAYKLYPNAYTYYKYLNALTESYGKANLVIVGDGVDSSKLYFGSFNADTTKDKE